MLETDWFEAAKASPGPFLFVAEAVFFYLREQEVRKALRQIADHFPGSEIVLDTVMRRALKGGNKDFAKKKMEVRFTWSIENPKEIDGWGIGLRLVESRSMFDVPDRLSPRVAHPTSRAWRTHSS